MSEKGHYLLIVGAKITFQLHCVGGSLKLAGIRLVAIKRENQYPQYTPQLRRNLNRIRKRIETTINQLND